MGRPILGEHTKLEVIIEESYEFKVCSPTLPTRSQAHLGTETVHGVGRSYKVHLERMVDVISGTGS